MFHAIALLAISLSSINGLRLNVQQESRATETGTAQISTISGSKQLQSASDKVWGTLENHMNFLKRQAAEGGKPGKSDLRIAMLQALKPCAQCEAPKRFGATFDGGYAMCSELMEKGKINAGYSVGISGYDNWGTDISTQLDVPIYQFDCTNSKRPPCETDDGPMGKRQGCNFEFYDLCITASKNRPENRSSYKTIKELMALHGHGKRGDTSDLLLQLDVEGYEWELFADPSTAHYLREFSQISVEFHNILNVTGINSPDLQTTVPEEIKLKALQNLNRQFVVTHIHGNNYEGMQKYVDPSNPSQEYSIPGVIEVLYVRRGMVKEQECMADPQYSWLDARNNPLEPEIAIPHLPSDDSA